jgi:hypothetical protein
VRASRLVLLSADTFATILNHTCISPLDYNHQHDDKDTIIVWTTPSMEDR